MRKVYLSLLGGLLAAGLSAQTKFWNNVPYQGAFPVTDNTPATDWTDGWANWDPENTVYPATTSTVSADITTNTTWTTGSVILLQNKVYVKNNATLTIQPGVIVRGDNATAGSLIITKSAKINAQGTRNSPIVFTSNEAVGNRAEGDWGGIIILGNAVSNQGTSNIEGLTATTDTEFGGSNDQDSSGVLSYIRIEFPGVEFQPNKEINGLTMGAVGSKTHIHHIQVSFSGDDSFEWFGGTVDAKYLIAFRGLDDDFDTDFGFRGRVQFGLIIRDKDLFDAAGDSNSFESDNDANGSNLQPLTAAVFSNITIVGPKRDGLGSLPVGEKFEKAFRIRRNSAVSCLNSLIIGWEKGLSIEGSATENNFTGDTAVFTNNLLVDLPSGANAVTAAGSFYATFFGADMNDSTKTKTQVNWVNPFPTNLSDMPDFRLACGSVAAMGASFANAKFANQLMTPPVYKFWTAVPYQGAFPITDNTSATDWTDGWANWDPENTVYPATTSTVSADITTNTTWTTGSVILLQNKVYVKNNATLTIQPGVIVRGDNATAGSLIITKGAKINAQGTKNSPIVFTSNEAVGNRAEGDWGGIIILGNAVSNQGTSNIEGLTATTDTEFGGSNDQDSSGVLSYIRIEFPGVEFQPNKEINGLTMGAVGSKTHIHHIQVSFSGDDSFEWFGGTVDAKYLIAFRGLDDDFDTDFGFRGRVQFGLIIRDKDLFDAAGDSNSFESDNDANGSNLQPLTAAVFSNITIVGPKRDGLGSLPVGEKFEKAFRIRRNSAVSCLNSLIIGWEKGLSIEGSATENNFTGDTAAFTNNLLVDLPSGVNAVTAAGSFYATFFGADMNDSTKTKTQVNWVNPFPTNLSDMPDFRLACGSVAAMGASFANAKFTNDVVNIPTSIKQVKKYDHTGISLFPNPTQNNATLWFELSHASIVNVSVYNLAGQQVTSVLNNNQLQAGTQKVNINTEELTAGIYFVTLNATEFNKTIKLVVNK